MKRGLSSLRRLRWKLTLSYTLVTVAALLVMELILIGVVLVFLNSGALPRLIAEDLANTAAPRFAPHLAQTPPDARAVREELELFVGLSGATNLASREEEDLDLTLNPDDGSLFVMDDERRLLASSPELEGFPVGERFDAGRLSGLDPLVSAALAGEENPRELSSNTPENRLMAAAPISDDEGRVVGVLAGSFQLPSLTVPVLMIVGVSAMVLLIPAGIIGTIFGLVTARGPARRLQNLAEASEAWSKGDFSVVVKDKSRDEIGQLSRDLNHMVTELENLMETRQELATLETRNRFARDLHDSVKQQVFATSLQVAAAKALISRDVGAAETHLSQAEELVVGAQKELNVLIHEMRPAALEDRGLAAALRDYVKDWSKRTEIQAEFHVRGECGICLEIERGIFRVAQEALANVSKHSGAAWAEVELTYEGGSVTLRVTDDGRGFDPGGARLSGGFGLESMHERAMRLGGEFEVSSAPGKGTRVVCKFPVGVGKSSENGKR